MAAAEYDITVEQGATFQLNITWKNPDTTPVNLTGYTARMQIREKHSSTTALVSLTSAAGDIVLGGVLGTIVVTIPATVTDDLTIKRGVYDLELISGSSFVTRLIEGCVNVTPEVTRG